MKCQTCDGQIVYPEGLNGEKICCQCGLVVEGNFSQRSFSQWTPEWYSNWKEQDSETIKEWLTTLRAVSCQLNIPNFPYREEAARTIRTQNHCLSKSQRLSKNKRATVAALMHLVLKEYQKARPIGEISNELKLDRKLVSKQTWILNKALNQENPKLKIKRKTASDYLKEKGRKIVIDKDVLQETERILSFIKGSGGNPIGVGAGALYFVCKNRIKVTKEEIGKAFGISSRTVYSNEVRIRKIVIKLRNIRAEEQTSKTELLLVTQQ
jgi:transcription initiation factor TFIIIB Brf1 subunit/transcription initiation factor TFIIB